MVVLHDGLLELHTAHTSYLLSARRHGLLENLHYGARIDPGDGHALAAKVNAGYGGDVLRPQNEAALSSLCLELSPVQRGDYRAGALMAQMAHGAFTSDYKVATVVQTDGRAPGGGMPAGRGADDGISVSFSEPSGLEVELFYNVFYDADVITKKMRITNRGTSAVELRRALSQQLDLPRCGLALCTLTGAWAREFQLTRRPTAPGRQCFGSNTGASGNRCNPFFFLAAPGATEEAGEVYGFNLVYSGSHEASVEVDTHGRTRVMQGISSEGFGWTLAPGESFVTPEAVLTFSAEGVGGMSRNMHRFVRRHILPPRWQDAPRSVLVNNWEGTYFRFNESKLLSMARVAAKLGVELFVLDDGWFGRRDSDKAGLGDYDVNRRKLPGGLAGLARKINAMGMEFGLWFEPEMVNEDSGLYRAHSDWIVQTPGYAPAAGRNQLVLDLCRPEVRRYIIESMGNVLDSANIRYVKWDMNRHISDAFSPALQNQGEFMHRYVLGLYELLEELCATRPDILFEGCSSGGNRFDLGMLHYMPQIWVSDDTDALERQRIQTGASYGYPLCTMGCHVSAVPNHQTLRKTPLETRFNTAAFGLLGYELDLTHLTAAQRSDVAAQIAFYKKHRQLLQYGDFYRLKDPWAQEGCRWMVVTPDQSEGMLGDFLWLLAPNSAEEPMRFAGLDFAKLYEVSVRPQKMGIDAFGGLINFVLPVHVNAEGVLVKAAGKVYRLDTEQESFVARGNLLCRAGIRRQQAFSGAGYSQDMRLVADFASRLYHVKEAPER